MTNMCSVYGNFDLSMKTDDVMKSNLTRREEEVIAVLMQGKTNEEIGKNLHVSINTIRTHLSSCYKKMKVKNRTELVIKYLTK